MSYQGRDRMKRLLQVSFLLSIALQGPLQAKEINVIQRFLPENNLKIPLNNKLKSGLDLESAQKISSTLVKIYQADINRLGKELDVGIDWQSANVNAYAMVVDGNFHIQLFGGLLRHPNMTEDALSLILCHEMGHFIGGAPLKTTVMSDGSHPSNEGQSDYFAALRCFKRIYAMDDNASKDDFNLPAKVTHLCDKYYANEKERALCRRSNSAALDAAKLLADAGKEEKLPDFETPDLSQVSRTFHGHPKAQCRLDTFLAGSLCRERGELSRDDAQKGTCNLSTGHAPITGRPGCWYKDDQGI